MFVAQVTLDDLACRGSHDKVIWVGPARDDGLPQARDRIDYRFWLILVHRMPAVSELQQISISDLAPDTGELVHRAVLVVLALHGKHRTTNAWQVFLDVPVAEIRMEPDPVPTPEHRLDVSVVARKLIPKVGCLEGVSRSHDVGNRNVLDKHMRRHQYESCHGSPRSARVDQSDRAAVTVADEDRAFDGEFVEKLR